MVIISRPAHRREIIICTMCVCTCVRACVCHAVFSETTTVTHFGEITSPNEFFCSSIFLGFGELWPTFE